MTSTDHRPIRSRRAGGPAVAALAVVGALALAACSSTTSTSSATSSSSTSTTSSSTSTTGVPATTTGSSDEPSSTTEPRSVAEAAACRLVTRADAEQAFGEPAVAGTQSSDECWWSTANDLKTINVIVRQPDLDSWRQGHQNSQWESVSLGDEGFAGKALDSIEFRVGDTVYEVNVVYSTKGDPQAVVQDLAAKVASRV